MCAHLQIREMCAINGMHRRIPQDSKLGKQPGVSPCILVWVYVLQKWVSQHGLIYSRQTRMLHWDVWVDTVQRSVCVAGLTCPRQTLHWEVWVYSGDVCRRV